MKPVFLYLSAAAVAQGALNPDGSRATAPISDDDPSPISDPLTYVPKQHDCPLPYRLDYVNVHNWTLYYSVARLQRYKMPMLLHFSVLLPLDDLNIDVLIRSCIIGDDPASARDRTIRNASSIAIDNPKLGADLFEPSANVAPACDIDGRDTSGKLWLTTSGGPASGRESSELLHGMEKFFSTKDNCDETFLFRYYKQTVASVYIGAGLGKKTAVSALQAVAGRLQAGSGMRNQTVAQICGGERKPEAIIGLSIDTTRAGNLAGVQKTAVA